MKHLTFTKNRNIDPNSDREQYIKKHPWVKTTSLFYSAGLLLIALWIVTSVLANDFNTLDNSDPVVASREHNLDIDYYAEMRRRGFLPPPQALVTCVGSAPSLKSATGLARYYHWREDCIWLNAFISHLKVATMTLSKAESVGSLPCGVCLDGEDGNRTLDPLP